MTELERDALARLQFALRYCNFKDVTEVNGEDLYREYDGFKRPKTQEEIAEEAAAAKRKSEEALASLAAEQQSNKGDTQYSTTTLLSDEHNLTGTTAGTLSAASPMAGFGNEMNANANADPNGEPPKSMEEVVAAAVAKHMDNNEMLRQDLVTVHGIVEFLRSGNASCLPARQEAAWARENPGNGGNALAMSGLAGRSWGSLTTATSMVKDGSRTWNDFLLQVSQSVS